MESQLVLLSDLDFNLNAWKREIKFQDEELDFFEDQLESIALRNLGKDIMRQLEGFQNKIIREKEVMGELRHKIRIKKREVAQAKILNKPEPKFFEKQASLREEMRTFIKMNYDLREDLMDFFLKNTQ